MLLKRFLGIQTKFTIHSVRNSPISSHVYFTRFESGLINPKSGRTIKVLSLLKICLIMDTNVKMKHFGWLSHTAQFLWWYQSWQKIGTSRKSANYTYRTTTRLFCNVEASFFTVVKNTKWFNFLNGNLYFFNVYCPLCSQNFKPNPKQSSAELW